MCLGASSAFSVFRILSTERPKGIVGIRHALVMTPYNQDGWQEVECSNLYGGDCENERTKRSYSGPY